MPRVELELETEQYQQLQQVAEKKGLTVEEEYRRRLVEGLQRSPYMEALLADLRAADEPLG
ncbi:hypothetical protein [Pseudomonas sp. LFM046]|uniref:hypothetical protein n=1 Tax=Pseudomonas sp. LFM046 TaxID=1608357 RepID=UPI0005CFC7D5|nr:hypothetical protein [Pseudomonas sp. LFM046]